MDPQRPAAPDATPPSAEGGRDAPQRPTGRRGRRTALVVVLLVLAVLTLPLAALWALGRSEAGTAWLLARVPGLQVEGLQGALLAERLAARRLVWTGSAGQLSVDGFELRRARWRPWPAPGSWLALEAEQAQAARVHWQGGAGADAPAVAPRDLVLPLQLTLPLRVRELSIGDLAPVQDLALTLALGADGGTAHRVSGLALRWQTLRLRDGSLQVGSAAPLPLTAALQLDSDAGAPLPWQAQLQADGTLARLALTGTLSGPEGSAAQLQAALQPFAGWPVETLVLTTEGLDLAALVPQAPRTQLRGRVELSRADAGAPLQAQVALGNQAPGRWDQGRLPLRRIEGTLQGDPAQPARVEITRLALQLAGADGDAGTVDGQGRWQDHGLTLDLRLAGVAPQRLDRRASAMTLGGPLALEIGGLPSPDPAAARAAGGPTLALQATLDGRLAALPQAVRLALQARAAPDQIDLASLEARAGGASARLQARARREGGRWALRSEGRLVDFDPRPWWPGDEGSAWRRGPHRLNAGWAVDASLPESAFAGTPAAALAAWRGVAELQLERSLLAGLPLDGTLALRQGAGEALAQVDARLTLAGNRLAAQAQLATAGDGGGDRWQIELDAPALAALAPLAALNPMAADWVPRAGSASGTLSGRGRWPALATEGRLRVRGLQAGSFALGDGALDWRLDRPWPLTGLGPSRSAGGGSLPGAGPSPAAAADASGPSSPGEVRLSLAQLRQGASEQAGTLATLEAVLEGTPSEHRLTLDAAAPVDPPARLAELLGVTPGQGGTRVGLQARGRWLARPPADTTAGAAGRVDAAAAARPEWRLDVERLAVDPWDGRQPLGGEARGDWLAARELALALQPGTGDRPATLHVDPARLTLAGGLVLRVDRAELQAAGGGSGSGAGPEAARWQLEATLEPAPVAPFLARAQPDLGWAGDLRAGATLRWQAGDTVDAELLIERAGGDLSVRDVGGQPLTLGLTDLRLALTASGGEWLFSQGLAGRTLGELGGVLRLRTTPQARWPGPDAALDGAVQARVADLGVWGAWVPPGWRLQGMLETVARFGGRLGAPEVEGTLNGSALGLRNLLQGVNVRDGEIGVRLQGDRATVERFVLKGGEGELRLRGGATLGAQPVVDLALEAERFQLLGRIDRRLVVSGNAALRLGRDRLAVDGALKVDEGLFDVSRADAPSLDDDVVVRRAGAPPPAPPSAARTPRRATEVALRIELGERLRLRGRGLDTRLAGDLRFGLPGGRPSLEGQVRSVGGTYAAYAQKLEIERGLVSFTGPPDNPRLDVLALRPNLDVVVGVAITGPVQSPRVRLYSEPDMSDSDKLSWLVLGRDPGTVDRADTALLQRAALALLAGEEGAPTADLFGRLGIDEFSVREGDGEGDTIVALGKQLSRRWYVGYERSVNATVGTWQLIYRAAQRFTLRLQSGLDNSVDAIWIWRIE